MFYAQKKEKILIFKSLKTSDNVSQRFFRNQLQFIDYSRIFSINMPEIDGSKHTLFNNK